MSLAGSTSLSAPEPALASAEIISCRTRPTARGSWFADFRFVNGRVEVVDTGAVIPLDGVIIGEALIWLAFHIPARAVGWVRALMRPDAPRIWFAPHRPRPWYMVWSATALAGLRFAKSPQEADVAFSFEDATWGRPMAAYGLPSLNSGCTDVSKSRVASLFEEAFGYPLAIDPTTWSGPAVRKSEANGAHDGYIIHCPAPAEADGVYQRLIDTSDGRFTYDLRTACVDGGPATVWIKRKALADRFSVHNLSVTLHAPEAVFSEAELAAIRRFLALMQADWAGLDILRDADGRIYVVDVNKTDVGPIIALPWADKIRSTIMLARALDRMVTSRLV